MASSSSAPSFACHLCPGGAEPMYPDAVLTVGSTRYTCQQLVSISAALASAQDCYIVQSGAFDVCCDPSKEWTCDPYNDPCPNRGDALCMNYQSPVDPGETCTLPTADCLDCDPCNALSYMGCDVCTFAGCVWCSGDSLCSSTPFERPYYPPPMVTIPSLSCVVSNGGGGSDGSSTKQGAMSSSFPVWMTSCPANDDRAQAFSDPRYMDNSWAFRLIKVESVWQRGITGTGVRIRINDVGVDAAIAELSPNFDVNGSCPEYLPSSNADVHGTMCASIAAAAGNNNLCSVGIAPRATLSSCKVLGTGMEGQRPDLLLHALDRQHVSSNSFGVRGCAPLPGATNQTTARRRRREQASANHCPFLAGPNAPPCSVCGDELLLGEDDGTVPMSDACSAAIVEYCSDPFTYEMDSEPCMEHLELFATCDFNGLAPSYQKVFTQAIRKGRDGKGLIMVFASGNEYATGSDANMNGVLSSRFTVAVGAVDKTGRHSSYSTPGACVLVSAPGGDLESASNWATAQPGGSCTDYAFGTSFAAPVVSGVIALVLEVNPNLGWRDVQGLLARTSQAVRDPTDNSWVTNAAGLSHSYLYGFGIVDASAAVDAATTWTNYGPEQVVSASSGFINRTIDDIGTFVNSTVTVRRNVIIETVVVYLNADASSRGHLEVRLVSPSGVESVLSPGMRPSSDRVPSWARWRLATVRNWGEASRGPWTLRVADTKIGDYAYDASNIGCVDLPFDDDYYYYFSQDCATMELHQGQAACDETPKAQEACCFCGGGQATATVQNRFVSWTIVVYGHVHNSGADIDTPAPLPTRGDEFATAVPSTQPSVEEAVVESPPAPTPIPLSTDAIEGIPTSLSSSSAAAPSRSGRLLCCSAIAAVILFVPQALFHLEL